MLAPRKTLWSTPKSVVSKAIEWVPLTTPGDKVCDIGCGDGRVLLQWAESYSRTMATTTNVVKSEDTENCNEDFLLPCFLGIDIDSDRIAQAHEALNEARNQGRIHARLSVSFHCVNALEAQSLYQDATVIFLYLIPRGLRIILQQGGLLQLSSFSNGSVRHVVTYMSPLPDTSHVRRELIAVPHQPGTAWPLFLYRFEQPLVKQQSNE